MSSSVNSYQPVGTLAAIPETAGEQPEVCSKCKQGEKIWKGLRSNLLYLPCGHKVHTACLFIDTLPPKCDVWVDGAKGIGPCSKPFDPQLLHYIPADRIARAVLAPQPLPSDKKPCVIS